MMKELPIIQKTYDLVVWYVPILNRLPRLHKYGLGDRMVSNLYDVLEELLMARFSREKGWKLERVNGRLDVLRYQTRMLHQFGLIDTGRYEHAARLIDDIGKELGGWIKSRRREVV